MRGSLIPAAAFLLLIPAAAPGSERIQRLTVTTQVEPRTSLHVSTSTLVFTVGSDGAATSSIDYAAAARTRSDAEVVLTVEPLAALDGPGGGADVDPVLTLDVDAGPGIGLSGSGPVSAARWCGSGAREGRLTFRLEAAAPGIYTVPVGILISAP